MCCTVTRHVSSSSSLKKGRRSAQSCESQSRRGRSQTTRGIRKRCRIRAGWRHEWIPRTELPPRRVLAIRQVIRGPFSSPRLVSASPYVLVSSYCKNGDSEVCNSAVRCPRIKRGIPDPWAEYLAYRGFCSRDDRQTIRRDIDLGCKNIYVTAKVWKDLGLPLGQGIPDPWKIPVSRNKWVGQKVVKPNTEKAHRKAIHRNCGCCKQCQASTSILSPKGCCHVDETTQDVDPTPEREAVSVQALQQTTLQHRGNFMPGVSKCSLDCRRIKEPEECTAVCNTHRYNHGPFDIPKPSLLWTQPSTGRFLTSPGRPEYSSISREDLLSSPSPDADIPDPQVSQIKLPQESKGTAKNLTNSGVQTSEILPIVQPASSLVRQKFLTPDSATQTTPPNLTYDFNNGQVISSSNKIAPPCQPCGCFYKGHFSVQDVACACDSSIFRKKRVGFDTRNLSCTESVCNRGIQTRNRNLNVTQLSCGCVHVSPCFGMPEYSGAANRYIEFQSRDGSLYPENAIYEESSGNKPFNPKPKMISRMKRLLNRCKSNKPYQGSGPSETVTPDIHVNKASDKATLVCCQCSCPYLKVGVPPEDAPLKTVARKKKKCVCGRCVAKRERRERRRSRKATMENGKVCISPRSCGKYVQVESGQHETIKCHNESCRMQFNSSNNGTLRDGAGTLQEPKQKALLKQEESSSQSVPQRNSSANAISPEEWRYPVVLGAPWYSSDSGENADVSETSKNAVQYASVLEASPETSLVTSCTFISRINHSAVLECWRKQQRRPSRGERLKSSFQAASEIDSESSASQNSLRRINPSQTPTPTNGSCQPQIIQKQIPLLNIEESDTKDSRKTSSRMACIDFPVDCVSFYKDEEMYEKPPTTDGDKKRQDVWGKCPKSRKKQIAKKSGDTIADGSQVTVNVDSRTTHNRLGNSSPHRSHLAAPKAELVLDETEDSTSFAKGKLRESDPYWKIQEINNATNPRDIRGSSDDSHSVSTDLRNSGYEPMITTIVSPRKIFTNSSTSCYPDSCTRKCRRAPVPMNTPTDEASSEDQGFPTREQTARVSRCQLPFAQSLGLAKSSALSDKVQKSLNSTPRRMICSPAKVDGFLEGEDVGSCDLNITEKSENQTPRGFVQEVRTLVPNGTYQGRRQGSADNKCFLKYCSLRRSGACVVSPSHKIWRIQHPSYLSNENGEDNVPAIVEKGFPLGRRAFSSSSYQRNPTAVAGDAFTCVPTHPLAKVQDKFNIG